MTFSIVSGVLMVTYETLFQFEMFGVQYLSYPIVVIHEIFYNTLR